MNYQIYEYVQRLHYYIEAQERRIQSLEKRLAQISKDMQDLKEKPSIRVERIDYKFDQLKIETLEGTLSIGLNPADLQAIEDLSIDNQPLPPSLSPEMRMQTTMELENEIFQYLDKQLPTTIQSIEQQLQMNVDQSYHTFIRQDIEKQLPKRIEQYLMQIPDNDYVPERQAEMKQKIIHKLKSDIENGVYTFLSELSKQQKGMDAT